MAVELTFLQNFWELDLERQTNPSCGSKTTPTVKEDIFKEWKMDQLRTYLLEIGLRELQGNQQLSLWEDYEANPP